MASCQHTKIPGFFSYGWQGNVSLSRDFCGIIPFSIGKERLPGNGKTLHTFPTLPPHGAVEPMRRIGYDTLTFAPGSMTDIIQREKIPPQNMEAEMSLLGSVLLDKDAMIKIADIIDPEDFYKDANATIFETMDELYNKNESVDLLTLGNRLEEKGMLEKVGGRTYLVTLSNTVPTAAHVKEYANIVRRKSTHRKLLRAAQEMVRLGYEEERENVDELLDEAQQYLYGVTQKHLKQSFAPIRSVLSEAFERIDELHKEKGKLRGIATGFHPLDNLLAGLQRSDLIVLAARPSVGKTSFALDIARHVGVRGKESVGIFSLEMSKEQLVDRLLCAEAGVDLWKMRTGNLSDRPDSQDFPRIGHAMGILSEAPLYIDDAPMNNVMHIRTNSDNRVQGVAEMSRNLKGIARELNVPVLALSQLSRAVEQSKPAIPK